MLRAIRLRVGPSVRSKMEGGKAWSASRDGGVRDEEQKRYKRSDLPRSGEYGWLTI